MGSTISTLLHDKINPKDCQVLSNPWWFKVSPIFEGCFKWWQGKPRTWRLGFFKVGGVGSPPKPQARNFCRSWMEGEQPQPDVLRGLKITLVVNYLLTGMIFQIAVLRRLYNSTYSGCNLSYPFIFGHLWGYNSMKKLVGVHFLGVWYILDLLPTQKE